MHVKPCYQSKRDLQQPPYQLHRMEVCRTKLIGFQTQTILGVQCIFWICSMSPLVWAWQVCSGALRVGRGKRNKPWAGVEAVAARNLDHPGIVRTLKHTAIILQARSGRRSLLLSSPVPESMQERC